MNFQIDMLAQMFQVLFKSCAWAWLEAHFWKSLHQGEKVYCSREVASNIVRRSLNSSRIHLEALLWFLEAFAWTRFDADACWVYVRVGIFV